MVVCENIDYPINRDLNDFHRVDYWKIWYEIFENGKMIGAGVWLQCYKHKNSAVRRAKKQFGEPRYNPITDSTYTYEWTVSQTNPWRREELA